MVPCQASHCGRPVRFGEIHFTRVSVLAPPDNDAPRTHVEAPSLMTCSAPACIAWAQMRAEDLGDDLAIDDYRYGYADPDRYLPTPPAWHTAARRQRGRDAAVALRMDIADRRVAVADNDMDRRRAEVDRDRVRDRHGR